MTMTRILIDNRPFNVPGSFIQRGGFNQLIAWPSRKAVTATDWPEENGIEADLSVVAFAPRTVVIPIIAQGEMISEIVPWMKVKQYHAISLPDLNRIYTMRYNGVESIIYREKFCIFKVKFTDEMEPDRQASAKPQNGIARPEEVYIDKEPLTAYGVNLLEGTRDELLKPFETKPVLYRTNKAGSYGFGDLNAPMYTKSRTVKIKCLMRAHTLTDLWRNYDSLFTLLTMRGEHILIVAERYGITVPFYYDSCSVSHYSPDGRPWIIFTLSLTQTREAGSTLTAADV